MKKLYFLVLASCLMTSVEAQIINFPDSNFKTELLVANTGNFIALDSNNNPIKIDANNDNEIEYNEALNVFKLFVVNSKIQDLTGISYFLNLTTLYCGENQLMSLGVSGLTNLQELDCNTNQIAALDIGGLMNLKILNCSYNQLTTLNVNSLTNLNNISCSNNRLSSLDVSSLGNLNTLICDNNILNSLVIGSLSKGLLLSCQNNQLSDVDLSLTLINGLYCRGNQLTSLVLDYLSNTQYIDFSNNRPLTTVFMRTIDGVQTLPPMDGLPNLHYVCINDWQVIAMQNIVNSLGYDCTVDSVCSSLGTSKYDFGNYFSLYPNPANDILNIVAKNEIVIRFLSVYNVLGQSILFIPNARNISTIDISDLTSGNYFIQINTDKGTLNSRFIKD